MNTNKVKLHISKENYYVKPPKNYGGKVRKVTQADDTIQEIEIPKLMKKISEGYSISPGVVIGGYTADCWTEQTLFFVDIDNKEDLPILTIKEALKICEENDILPIFYYYTYSSTKELPRYRLVFQMDKTITDTKIREKIINTLLSLFLNSDTACNSASSFFYGTNKKVIQCDLNSRITTDKILSLSTFETIENYNRSNDSELEQLKRNFDLLSYMEQDNEVLKTNGNITYFKNCSICGHYDCLRYYHNSNSFYCFGANGIKGGTIIDYIMYMEKLSLKSAIDKFKYELCGIGKYKDDNNNENNYSNIEYFSAEDLQNMNLPPVIFYVDKLIPQGLTLICSVPKLGKSWLALQLCLSIVNGKKFLGFDTKKCGCLYLALEDSKNRLKDRTTKLLGESSFPSNLYFNNYNKNISAGLVEELNKVVKSHNDIKVIVIDTLQKIRSASKTTNIYANDYKELSILKTFADKNDIAIILIHHLRKAIQTTDVFDRVSGTNGITGTVDTTIILSKDNRNDKDTKMSVVGRDVEYNEYLINFDIVNCNWNMKGCAEELSNFIERQVYKNNTLIKTIKLLLKENNNVWQGIIKDINEKHHQVYHHYYRNNNSSQKLKYELERLEKKLFQYDRIVYIPAEKNPTIKGRIITIKKFDKRN